MYRTGVLVLRRTKAVDYTAEQSERTTNDFEHRSWLVPRARLS